MLIDDPITNQTPLSDLADYAEKEVKKLLPGEIFIVRDLFLGYEWNRIGKGNRTKLGGIFFRNVKEKESSNIEILDKTPQNQQRYRKKEVV